ncbi:MAG: VOC family protein [Deltaproteobacteria bacterium]
MRPAGPHHIAIQARDLEGLERWYRETLGLSILRRWPGDDGRDRALWLDLGAGAFVALERCADAPGPTESWERSSPGLFVLALRIPKAEREAWEARLAANGVTIERRSKWSLFFRDPEGNRLALSHHPEE